AALMATWSSMERARRSILWTTTAPIPPSAMRRSMAFSMGRSAVRADSPAWVNSPASPIPFGDMAKARFPLGRDRVALAGLVLGCLLLGGDPQVDHRVHGSSSSCPCSSDRHLVDQSPGEGPQGTWLGRLWLTSS